MRWSDIDFTDRTLTVPETKNGEDLTLPLSDYLYDLLQTRRKRYGNYKFVFPGSGKSGHLEEPKKAARRVKDMTGIVFTIHDLRRTFITIAESLDISMYALKRLINHKITNDITGGYIVVDVERLRAPVQRVADYILESALKGQTPENAAHFKTE
ncbi:MAG: tyrosine-type recombinase/integrase [Micavibrio sp.]|nr:tyrosine-type recombinase/integrase [Micavibrio sp.]